MLLVIEKKSDRFGDIFLIIKTMHNLKKILVNEFSPNPDLKINFKFFSHVIFIT